MSLRYFPNSNVVPAQAGTYNQGSKVRASFGSSLIPIQFRGWIPDLARKRSLVRDDNYLDRFSRSRLSARAVKARMLPCRSLLPVSSVITCETGPAIAMQL
jgi:hypothetical protein